MAERKKLDPKSDLIGETYLRACEALLEHELRTLQQTLARSNRIINKYSVYDPDIGSSAFGDLHSYLEKRIEKCKRKLKRCKKD